MVDFATIARMIRLPEGLSRVWVQPTLADWWIMLALAEPETNKQLSWGDLVEEGVADMLIEQGWVLPGKKSSDAVALTAKGLAEAAKIELMLGED